MKPPSLWPRWVAGLRNLHPGIRRRNRLAPHLAQVTAAATELDRAMQGIEAGFLQIGASLETTIQIEQKLVAQSRSLLGLAEGPEGGTAIISQAAAHIWHGIEFAESNDQQVVKFIERLAETSRKIQITLPAQQALTEALTPLKYVQILFRVESATLPTEVQSTFLALNSEITRICERVETGFNEKFALIANISTRLDEAQTSLSRRQSATRRQLDALRHQLETSLNSVQADHDKNQARDLRMEAIVPQVKRETGTVVMSLQAQDMLNQKLQHLHTVLGEMASAQRTLPHERLAGGRTLRFLEQAGRLVSAQLDVMKGELAAADSQVGGGLTKIIGAMASLNKDFGAKQHTDLESLTIDGVIQNLIEALENVGNLIRASHQLVEETHRTIEPVRGLSTHFTRFMRELTLDIHLIGLNAEVQSAHVATGTGLEVVSARATEVSLTTCRLSEQLATDIDRITEDLGEMIDSFGQFRTQTETFVGQLTLETKADEDRLHDYRDQVIQVLVQISEQLPLLEEQINTALGHADFSTAAMAQIEALQVAVSGLETTAAALADAHGVPTETTGLMDQFLKGYTMRSQVDVHQRTLATAPAEAGAATGATPGANAEVDLFGFDDLGPETPITPAHPAPQTASDVDLRGEGESPLATQPSGATPLAPAAAGAMEVELWGDDEVVKPTPAAAPEVHRST
jgi:hypothetical protein